MQCVVRALVRALVVVAVAGGGAAATPGSEIELDRSAADDLYVGDRPLAPAPVLTADVKVVLAEREQLRDGKRSQAIGMLRELLASELGPDSRADALFKLAELLWEDAKRVLVERMDRYDRELEACRRTACATTPVVPRIDLRESEQLYRVLLDEHPDFAHADLVTYLIGFAAREDGREADALDYFTRVVERYPASHVAGDAWMMIGEHHFATEAWAAARDAYAHVVADPTLPTYDLALFKTAWTDWKLTAVDTAAREFGLLLAKCDQAATRKAGMCDETLDSLLAIFVEDRRATAVEVHGFLTSVGGDRYATDVLVKVGERYAADADYERSADVYGYLIEHDPDAIAAGGWQRAIVDGWNAALDPGQAQAAIGVLIDHYGPRSAWATARRDAPSQRDAIARSLAATEHLVRTTARNLHAEAQQREKADRCKVAAPYVPIPAKARRCGAAVTALFATAADAYARYLDGFGAGASTEVRYLRGQILYFKLDQLEAAGDEMMKVARSAPVGDLHRPALELAMDAYERARPTTPGSALVPVDTKFGEALELYASLYPGKNVGALLYRNGRMFFDHAMYDQAIARWTVIVDTYPDQPDAVAAADGILDSANKLKDYARLETFARKFKKLAIYAGSDQQARLARLVVESIAKIGDGYADAGRYELAAKAYLRLQNEFPTSALAPEKLMNAGVMMEKAKRPERAGGIYLDLAEAYPKHALAPAAAFTAGVVLERVAAYDRAATAYEVVARRFRSSAVTADAVYNAGRLRQALGEYKPAIAHYRDYAAHFANQPNAIDVAFNIGVVLESAGRLDEAEQEFARYAQRYAASGDRVIEAYVRAGRAAFGRTRDRRASDAFADALREYKRATGAAHAAGAVWAAEARYYQGELVYRRFQAISLSVDPAALEHALQQKLGLLADAKKLYDSIASFNEPRWFTAALYRTGSVYDQFADALAAAPIPDGLTGAARTRYRAAIADTVIQTQALALQQFEAGFQIAKDKQLYDHNTVLIHRALQRLDPVGHPPEQEARDGVRTGDRALQAEMVQVER